MDTGSAPFFKKTTKNFGKCYVFRQLCVLAGRKRYEVEIRLLQGVVCGRRQDHCHHRDKNHIRLPTLS